MEDNKLWYLFEYADPLEGIKLLPSGRKMTKAEADEVLKRAQYETLFDDLGLPFWHIGYWIYGYFGFANKKDREDFLKKHYVHNPAEEEI